MELKDYLRKNHFKLKHFCESHELEYGYLRHIANKRKRPSPDMALKIEQATNGEVSRMELLYPDRAA
jgi:hypothetical protein